ncbi:hypothetical protein [Streptomyces sp. LaBMicrA B280]|uniref:hypothetical protein n=1 Tax=Streptomyces sp. LaBMicrA B280 TaxID=3391001 RepID=UPI003BA42909
MSLSFSHQFNVQANTAQGAAAQFGTNVLAGLVGGIDTFRSELEQQRRSRSLGAGMLGAFLWVDDTELLRRIAEFPSACVVVSKQPRSPRSLEKLRKVADAVQGAAGFPTRALPDLEGLRLHEDGAAPVLGPGSASPDIRLSALRSLGYRRVGDHLVPILHTKMLLLGELWWHDEDALGGAADVIGFSPSRLWLGSANGTESSRRSLEFGLWTRDPDLMKAAQKFLVEVVSQSEELDPGSDTLAPDLVEPDYDDEEMREALTAPGDSSTEDSHEDDA